jgi:hypothetical protein
MGATGSGKTYAMLKLMESYYGVKQIQLLDTKNDSGIAELDAPVVEHLDDLPEYTFPEYPLVIYRPAGEELADLECLDLWCQWIYMRKNTHAVIDELTQLGNSTHPKMGFLNMLTRGRDRNISVFMGTQRPVGIPKIAYTESQHFYKFYLADEDDRKSVKKYTHPAMIGQVPTKHGFHYYKVGSRTVYLIKTL